MKKRGIFLLMLLLVVSLTACGSEAGGKAETSSGKNGTQAAPEGTAIASLEELSDAVNCALIRPEGDDISNERYEVIEENGKTIGKYSFTVNGIACWLRCADATSADDISGVENAGSRIFENAGENIYHYENQEIIAERWMTVDGQYIFVAEDTTMDYDAFKNIAEQFEAMTPKNWNAERDFADYQKILGYYGGSGATMNITMRYDHVILIGASILENGAYAWQAEASLDGDRLVYDKETMSYTDNEDETKNSTQELAGGTITILADGGLDFSGVNSDFLKGATLYKY